MPASEFARTTHSANAICAFEILAYPLVARLKVLSGYASIVRSEDRWHPNGYLPKIPAEEILINVLSFLISAGCTPGKRD
jgi:hypothetical protein